MKDVAKEEGYLDLSKDEFAALEKKLSHDLDKDLDLFRDEITELISLEIVKRYYYQRGETAEMLKKDKVYTQALELLKDKQRYDSMLTPKEKENAAQTSKK